MEPIKKRRNSILKKKPTEEDTTTEIKARRISFSGKKSIKEFTAGEEAATIWGTSYEESADDLKASASESGLVNVHVKRIQLRNRRVVCETQSQPQQKRRSTAKKKVLIAANDKENVCIFQNPPSVEDNNQVQESTLSMPPSSIKTLEKTSVEQTQSISPIKSELAIEKSQKNVSNIQTSMPPPQKFIRESLNPFSSTFDFINFSGHINRTITIEQSVDVSLNESEIQMFKFRVPVTTRREVSPNASNIFCQSILMTDEDVDCLKMIRKQNVAIDIAKHESSDNELQAIESKKIGTHANEGLKIEELADEKSSSAKMEISDVEDSKANKRKSERKPLSLVLDTSLSEMNSPLRKKPMHNTLYCSTMDVTNNLAQTEPKPRSTIHESIAIDESGSDHTLKVRGTVCYDSFAIDESGREAVSQTIYGSQTINESSSFPNTTASCLAMGHHGTDGNISMELSIYEHPNVKETAKTNCQTIHFNNIEMENTRLDGLDGADHLIIENKENIIPSQVSQTIYYDCSEIEDVQEITKDVQKQRQSIYAPSDMILDDAECKKDSKTDKNKGLKIRQTIHTMEDISQENPQTDDYKEVLEGTISTPINIYEDSIQIEADAVETKAVTKDRKTIYQPVEIEEDFVSVQKQESSGFTKKPSRGSMYTPTSMPIEESSKPCDETDNRVTTGLKVKRKTIVRPVDMMEEGLSNKNQEETTAQVQENGNFSKKASRGSIYIPTNMNIEESTNSYIGEEKKGLEIKRKTIVKPVDIIEDGSTNKMPEEASQQEPENENLSKKPSRKSIYTPANMNIEESSKPCGGTNNQVTTGLKVKRKTIVKPVDIIEDCLSNKKEELTSVAEQENGNFNKIESRGSIYILTNMHIEPASKPCNGKEKTVKTVVKTNRKTIVGAVDIIEDEQINQNKPQTTTAALQDSMEVEELSTPTSPKVPRESVDTACLHSKHFNSKNESSKQHRQTICKPVNINDDSINEIQNVLSSQLSVSLPTSSKNRRTIIDNANIDIDNLSHYSPSKTEPQKELQKLNSNKTISHTIDVEEAAISTKPIIHTEFNRRQTMCGEVDINIDTTIAPKTSSDDFKPKQKSRLTINTPADIEEETVPKKSLPQPSKIQVFRRQLSSTDLISKKSSNQENLEKDKATCSSKIPGLSIKKRQSIHTPMEMEVDFPKTTTEAVPCKLNRKTDYTVTDITKTDYPKVKPVDNEKDLLVVERVEKQSKNDLPFRKPTQLNMVSPQSSEEPYSSPNSYMNKIMQDMGYSINFQLEFPSESAKHQSTSPSGHMYSRKDFDPSTNMFSLTQSSNASSQKLPHQTMFLEEGIELENVDGNNSNTHDRTSQLCKTLVSQSLLMDISTTNEMNLKENKQQSLNVATKLSAETMHEDLKDSQMIVKEDSKSKRQTIHFNQNLDLEDITESPRRQDLLLERDNHSKKEQEVSSKRLTIHCNQDLDLEDVNETNKNPPSSIDYKNHASMKDSVRSSEIFSSKTRQTIHCYEDLDTDDVKTPLLSYQNQRKLPLSQTLVLNQDIEEEDNGDDNLEETKATISKHLDLKINHSHKDLQQSLKDSPVIDEESTSKSFLGPLMSSRNISQQRKEEIQMQQQLNANQQVLPINKQQRRRTMVLNEDIDMSVADELQQVVQQNPSQFVSDSKGIMKERSQQEEKNHIQRRQTILMNQDLDLVQSHDGQELSSQKLLSQENLQKPKRQTIYINQNVEVESEPNKINKWLDFTKSKRKTILLNQDLDMTIEGSHHDETSKKAERNECNFNKNTEIKARTNRQTIHFQDDNCMDESIQANTTGYPKTTHPLLSETNQVLKKQAKRVTIYEEQPLNIETLKPNKETLEDAPVVKVLCKPRHVTICEEMPIDMNESELPKSTARKSSFSRTLNFDEIPNTTTATTTSIAKTKLVTLQSASEDDKSPIYNPSFKAKVPLTPGRNSSLAEYLRLEQALEEDEVDDIDETMTTTAAEQKNKHKTCRVPAIILDESGMQPLPTSQSLRRQTTFSPRKMINDSKMKNETSLMTSFAMEVAQPQTKIDEQMSMDPHLDFKFNNHRSKTSTQKYRQTMYFDNSINTSDFSMTGIKVRPGMESVNELLAENTRLFSQPHLMVPNLYFENQRSTMFFAGKDASMEVDGSEAERTPTKNKISKIPQLIGSAKKLESLKKSMEFIQQELPNIGCQRLRNMETFEEEQETPKSVVENNSKENEQPEIIEAHNLNETFDTIEIPRKIFSSVRKTTNESVQKLEEPQFSNENQRITMHTNPPTNLEDSLYTIDIPRRTTTFQRNETLFNLPNELEITKNTSQKSLFQLEDAPITISDVSTFFTSKKNGVVVHSPTTTKILSKSNLNELRELSKSPDSSDTTRNLADYKKRYVELTCASIELSDAIEKTHLSLVNTLDDESEMVYYPPKVQTTSPPSPTPPVIDLTAKNPITVEYPEKKRQQSKVNSSVCRKCKCRRLSTTQNNETTINDTTIGSFRLETLPVYKIDFTELEELNKKPKISNIGKHWRQKLRASNSFCASDESLSMAIDDEVSEEIETLLKELEEVRLQEADEQQEEIKKEIKIESSFVHRVLKKMDCETNWMINDILLFGGTILLTHKHLRTMAIVIYFTPKDARGVEVSFDDIKLKTNRFHTSQWTPYEHALHFQLLIELPYNLRNICPTSSENFFEFLDHVEKITQDVIKTGKGMLSHILPSPAKLLREPSGRIYIRKYVRSKIPQNDVKITEVHIEVRNIKKISYESITMPPLYEFEESIQFLPVGNEFLQVFLEDPTQFLKA